MLTAVEAADDPATGHPASQSSQAPYVASPSSCIWTTTKMNPIHSVPEWKLCINPSSPNDLAEFWESEPIGICKNINSIHDQGCGYPYLEDRRLK